MRRKTSRCAQRVAVAEVGQQVDRQAQSDAQQMMGELQAETARQKQELEFYRGLVVRQYGSGALRVQELRVRPEEEERRFLVLITLVQAATRDTVANGTVTFSVEGQQGKEPLTLALRGDRDRQAQAVPVLAALLPADRGADRAAAGFRPERLHVEYRLGRNPEPTKQTFDWRVEGGWTRRRFDPPRAGT